MANDSGTSNTAIVAIAAAYFFGAFGKREKSITTIIERPRVIERSHRYTPRRQKFGISAAPKPRGSTIFPRVVFLRYYPRKNR